MLTFRSGGFGAGDDVFSAAWGPAEPETDGAILESRLAFHGRPSGTFSVCLSEPAARLMAAGFLGEDEGALTDAQTGQVVCELANMLCGSMVSKLESKESFDIGPPELVPFGNDVVAGFGASAAARQSFELEGGVLTVTLHLKAAA